MIVRWVESEVRRKSTVSDYYQVVGRKKTLWLLFVPLFSIVTWGARNDTKRVPSL